MSSVSVVTNALRLRKPSRGRVADSAYLAGIAVLAIAIGVGFTWLSRTDQAERGMNGVLSFQQGMGMPMRPQMSVMEETDVPPLSAHDAGLIVAYDVPADVRPGEPATITISVRDAESGDPVDDLVRTHQVWMHLIVTRADLGTFAHLHPEPTGEPGALEVEATFPTAGTYAMHTEMHRQGQMADVLDATEVTVAGGSPTAGRSRPTTSGRRPWTAYGSPSTGTPRRRHQRSRATASPTPTGAPRRPAALPRRGRARRRDARGRLVQDRDSSTGTRRRTTAAAGRCRRCRGRSSGLSSTCTCASTCPVPTGSGRRCGWPTAPWSRRRSSSIPRRPQAPRRRSRAADASAAEVPTPRRQRYDADASHHQPDFRQRGGRFRHPIKQQASSVGSPGLDRGPLPGHGVGGGLLLVTLPFVPVKESVLTGAVCADSRRAGRCCVCCRCGSPIPSAVGGGACGVHGRRRARARDLRFPAREVLGWVWPPTLLLLVIWMLHQTRRHMRSRSGRVQLYLVFTILAISAVGGSYATVLDATDSTAMPATGRLIDVGGHKLYLNCVGSGSPTVVLEPGAGATSSQLGWIAPAVAASTRVCVYDRAGRGWSETADSPQDGARIATDLHTLLHRGGVAGPYVLAGHSFGGLYVRIFAAHYPDEVAGLALLDSTASKEPARSVIPSFGSSEEPVRRVPVLMSLSARVGLPRFLGSWISGRFPRNPETRREPAWRRRMDQQYRRRVPAWRRFGAGSSSLRDFADKPLFVLTAGEHPASWMASQNMMLTLSTNSVQQIVAGATHTDVVLEEKYAAATAQAILAVVDSVRSDRPLSR